MYMTLTLKQARRMRDKTQKEMAELLNVGKSTYIAIEKNPSRCTIAQAKKISEILGLSAGEIFFDQNVSI